MIKILVIVTLDTKAEEAEFICRLIKERGHEPVLIDPGILGQAGLVADHPREEVALASGHRLADLIATKDKAFIQTSMITGLQNLVTQLYRDGQVDGVISVGGGQGTAMATAAMQTLPVGIPKFMVSTVACGQTTFGPYVGTKDVTMLHSVSDISGLNPITTNLISQAVAATIAMAEVNRENLPQSARALVAITSTGVTTPAVMQVKSLLQAGGFDVIVFHGNGIGGEAMEEMIMQGKITGVIDLSPHDIVDLLYDGMMPAPKNRLEAASLMGIPQIILPGCADMLLKAWREDFPPELLTRNYVRHTPTHTHFRTTFDEMYAVGKFVTERVNKTKGEACVIVPLKGYSMLNALGKPLWDDHANRGFLEAVKAGLSPKLELLTPDYHINDPETAAIIVEKFVELSKKDSEVNNE